MKSKCLFAFVVLLLAWSVMQSASAAPGDLDLSFDPGIGPNNGVNAVAVQSDGKVIIGGTFTTVGGNPRPNLARLNADGTLDTAYNPSPDGLVQAITLQEDGKALIVGFFTTVNGASRPWIARVQGSGTVDTSFDAGTGFNNPVRCVAVQADGHVLIGGFFTTVGSDNRGEVARLQASGIVDPTFVPSPGLTGNAGGVYAIEARAGGKVLVGGDFTRANLINRTNAALFNTDGTLDTGFTPSMGMTGIELSAVTQLDGKVLVGGNFQSVGGGNTRYLARLNPDGSSDTGFNLGTGPDATVWSIALQVDGKALIGGSFTNVNGVSRHGIARLNTDGSLDSTFNPGTGAKGTVLSVVVQSDGKVVLGGSFGGINGLPRRRVARLQGGTKFTVTTTADSGPGSLRQAITDANAGPTADFIDFNIAPGGAQTITPLSPLPDITNSVTIDGTTQPGFSGRPIIELNGANAGPAANGLTVTYDAVDTLLRGFVINRFSSNGVYLLPYRGIVLEGSYVGTDLSGTVALGNQKDGVFVFGGLLSLSRVGGTTVAARNVISGNHGYGVRSALCSLLGNYIGTDVSGQFPLGNGNGGVTVLPMTMVGDGTSAGQNRIAYNAGNGIEFGGNYPRGSTFIGNSIYANAGLGIDLGTNGVTLNDAGDGDTGPNGLQNFPVLTAATNSSTNLIVLGTLNSGTNKPYRIDFYSNAECDPSGYGEGKTYLGFTNVMTDANANASFRALFPTIAGEPYLAATATDTNGNTSEFSLCLQTVEVPPIGVRLTSVYTGNIITISWPATASAYSLECSTTLTRPVPWQTVSSGIVYGAISNSYVVTNPSAGPNRFYRLRFP